MTPPRLFRFLMLLVLLLSSVALPSAQARPSSAETARQSLRPRPSNDPVAARPALQSFAPALAFVPAGGQGRNEELRFEVHGRHGTLFLTPRETIFALPTSFPAHTPAAERANAHATQQAMGVVRQRFVGAAVHPKLSGLEQQPGIVNDYIGDQSAWRMQVPTYAAVQFYAMYPGIDLRYDGQDGQLKRSFFVAPGANPAAIQWRYQGVDTLQIDPTSGDLQLHISVRLTPAQQAQLDTPQRTMAITMTERAPRAWQETPQGRVAVPVQFALGNGQSVQFALGAYDHSKALVIDPTIMYSQAYGGSGGETLHDMVVDNTGQLIVVGTSSSTDFGTTTYGNHTILGNSYAIASAVVSDTGQLLWTTRLGDNDKSSQAFSVTRSSPTGAFANTIVMSGATEGDYPGGGCATAAATLTRLETLSGTLVASHCWVGSYPGASYGHNSVGSTSDDGVWMAVNYMGEATKPWSFPSSGVTQSYAGGSQTPSRIYVVRVDASLSSATQSIALGGAADSVNDLAVDSADRPIVVGKAASRLNQSGLPLFPTTGNAIQSASAHSYAFLIGDMFATRLSTTGSLDYSTFLSGSHYDAAEAVSITEDGQWVVGGSSSPAGGSTAPLTSTAWSTSGSAYVARINPSLSGLAGLTYGSLVGGGVVRNVATLATRISVVGGSTDDTMFGSVTPLLAHSGGGAQNGFAATLETTQAGLPFATFLPSYYDARGLVLTTDGDLMVGGDDGSALSQLLVTRIDTSNIQAQSLTLSITDANGQPVTSLLTQDGWPLLNANGSGAFANPLTVKALVSNASTGTQDLNVRFDIGTLPFNTANRFYVFNEVDQSICAASHQPSVFSYAFYRATCTLQSVPIGGYRELTWHVWVQPSVGNQIPFKLTIFDQQYQQISQATKTLNVPLAHIRPVVVVPGFLGSYARTWDEGSEWVLDPIVGAYDGLVNNLRRLGYEDNRSLIPFPYKWYGEIKDPSRPNDIAQHAHALKDKIDNWQPSAVLPYIATGQVDLVAHSTGGIITRYYVTVLGDANKLHTVEFVGVPNQGSPMAYYGWEGGAPYEIHPDKAFVLTNLFLGSLAIKAGCYYYNAEQPGALPSTSAVDRRNYVQGIPCKDPLKPQNGFVAQPGVPLIGQLLPSQNATVQHPYLYRTGTNTTLAGPSLGAKSVLDSLNTPANVDKFVQDISTGGKLYMVYGSSMSTFRLMDVVNDPLATPLWMDGTARPIKVYSSQDNEALNSRSPKIDPDPVTNGDDTVPSWSADLHEIASNSWKSQIYTVAITGTTSHLKLFNWSESGRAIIARLVNSTLGEQGDKIQWINSLPFEIPPDKQDYKLIISNKCPVTMLITDPQGRRVGSLPNGQVVNEIPDAYYSGDLPGDDPELITIPTPLVGQYTVAVTGQRADPFTISALLLSDTALRRVGIFMGTAQPGQILSTTMIVYTPTAPLRRLLVDDGTDTGTLNLYQAALTQLGYSVDIWHTAVQGLPTLSQIYAYDSVLWATGANALLSNTTLLMLNEYANNGGAVLLSGQNADAGITDTVLLSETLNMQIANPSTTSQTLQGTDLLSGLSLHLNGGDSVNNQTTPSALLPFAGIPSLATYTDGSGVNQAAGMRATLLNGRLVFLGFGIEGLQTSAERVVVLNRLLRWLETGETPATSFPSTTILDDFNRADGPVGANWLGAPQNFNIAGNTLENVGGNTDALFWNSRIGPDQEVFATLTQVDTNASEVDLLLKAQDSTPCNLLEVWYQPSRGTAQVWTCHSWGTWTQHGADIPITLAPGDQFGARAQADGTVTVYKNGTAVGNVTVDSSWPYVANGGRVGVWLIDAPGTVLDDVGGGTLP